MPKLSKEIKEQIDKLSCKDLKDIVVKTAAKEKSVYDYLLINYLDKEYGENDLFDETKNDLEVIFRKRYKGFSQELQLANMLAACIKRINEFSKHTKNKVYEADLLLFVLEVPFSLTTNLLGTCFTQYDTKVAMILKRLINVVEKKLHEDYKVDYKTPINDYLKILHKTSDHINTVYNLPLAI
ncbi:MAG: hypothetical protein R2777_00430 [Chitinophagales bacterium]|nr:hypothetical protein [Chitinophagales bacterium]